MHMMGSPCCLRYCKSTIFQANHNDVRERLGREEVVCDTAKVRFFKQITTGLPEERPHQGCLRYCKSTIFQANHNANSRAHGHLAVVCDTAKVRFFKQITTDILNVYFSHLLFAILQKYDFSSKSQPGRTRAKRRHCCLRYCKSTIFQANHNRAAAITNNSGVVCDTAKVRFFKQITTMACLAHTIT